MWAAAGFFVRCRQAPLACYTGCVRLPVVAESNPEAPDLEALCRRCGVSCHFAIPVNGLPVVIDEVHCRYLARDDDGLYRCTVYPRRYELAPWCHSAADALPLGLLAQDCPYAHHARATQPDLPPVRGKARLSPRLRQQVLPAVIAEILRVGVPAGADPAPVAALLLGATGAAHQHQLSEDGARWLFSPAAP